LISTLNEPDKQILSDQLFRLNAKLEYLIVNIDAKLESLSSAMNDMKELTGVLTESREFIKETKFKANNLDRPVGSKIEDSQNILHSYEVSLSQIPKIGRHYIFDFNERGHKITNVY